MKEQSSIIILSLTRIYGICLCAMCQPTHNCCKVLNWLEYIWCLQTTGFSVTLQAQREYPLDMQCKDKFLLQSTIVPPPANVDELPPDTVRVLTWRRKVIHVSLAWLCKMILYLNNDWFYCQFNKDSDGKVIQEMKLRVVYMPTSTTQGNLEDEVLLKGSEKSPDANSVSFIVFGVC
jgi:hypothetical protein